ncbi:MAG: hypothetical protein JWQ79_688 [Mucilaginibacter sp.]|nr:hypothetical protein [Mucilaginibacter sp.]
MLLYRTGPLPCKTGKTTGYVLLPGCHSLNATTSAKSLMPFATTQGHQFYLLSPEAFLLTVLVQESFQDNGIKKKRGAVRARGRESGLVWWQRSS